MSCVYVWELHVSKYQELSVRGNCRSLKVDLKHLLYFGIDCFVLSFVCLAFCPAAGKVDSVLLTQRLIADANTNNKRDGLPPMEAISRHHLTPDHQVCLFAKPTVVHTLVNGRRSVVNLCSLKKFMERLT